MALGHVLDVVIGLAFTYFLLSAITSGLQEIIAGWLTWRGTYLSKAIDVIIDNDSTTTWRWGKDFWRAHFTTGAATTSADRLQKAITAGQKEVPPVVSPAQVLLQRVLSVHTHPLVRGTPSDLPSYIPSRNFAMALLETLRDGSQSPLVTQVETTISQLPAGDLKQTLSLFLQTASGDIDKFRSLVENWFDDAMDRVSGIYKRLSQYVLLILGLVFAVVLNVDSIHLARVLWQEDAMRSAIVAEAAATAGSKAAPGSFEKEMQDFEDSHIPYGWSQQSEKSAQPPIPVDKTSAPTSHPDWLLHWIAKIVGWLITALAVALGAPFWFGLLQQLTNLRDSGPQPARADAKPRA